MRKTLLTLGVALVAATALSAFAAVPAASQTQVVEFYNATLDHYFITADPKEAADLDSGVHVGWVRTGLAFQGVTAGATVAGTTPICRFYGKPEAGLDSHFYSASALECAAVKQKFAAQWQFESEEVFRAFAVDPNTGKCPADTEAIYRLWNKRADVNHRYTDQLNVFQSMVAKGYVPEGDGNPSLPVVFCTPVLGVGTSAAAPPGTPSCTIAAPTITPPVGSVVTLTATCTLSPTRYNWTGCTSATNTCAVTAGAPGTSAYSLSAANATGTGNTAQISLAWQVSGPLPICTVSATTQTPLVGNTLVLSANCSQTPTRYDWMECNYEIQSACNLLPACSSTSLNCAVTASNAGFAHYALTAGNANGLGDRAGIDVEWKTTGSSTPTAPVCALSASNNSPTIGSMIVLAATCSGSPTTYTWTGCASSGSSCSASSSTTGSATYSVVAGNAVGNSPPASVSVNWQTQPVPSCTVSASKTSPMVGESITMTASCSANPSGYTWTNCTGNGAQCTATANAAGPQTYSVVATNGTGPGQSSGVTVTWQPAPTAAPVCTLTASSTSPFTGSFITLTAACSNQPSSYTWTGCSGSGSSCTVTSNNAGSATYSVKATNVVGTGADASVTVNWQQSTQSADFCSAYSDVLRVSIPWKGFVNARGFLANGVLVGSFTVPAGVVYSPGASGIVSGTEYGDPPVDRTATLSTSPCDFGQGGPGVTLRTMYGGQPNTLFTVTGAGFGIPQLVGGQTYYFNVRNYSQDLHAVSCTTKTCDMQLSVNAPN